MTTTTFDGRALVEHFGEQEPRLRSLALRLLGDPGLVDDALQ